jgi:hypothetical protein
MITIRKLLLAAAILSLASPAMAGNYFHWWTYRYMGTSWSWACGAFEYRHKCNAELSTHTNRCGCIVR